MSKNKPKGLFILGQEEYDLIYGEKQRSAIRSMVDIYHPFITPQQAKESPRVLQGMQFLFTGWQGPVLDSDFLDAAKNLEAVFYAGGSLRGVVTDEFWDKDIPITCAWEANAVPVAEFTISQIIFGLKIGWQSVNKIKAEQKWPDEEFTKNIPGCYGSTVGLVSLGAIGKRVCKLLSSFDVNIIAYDPFITQAQADSLAVKLCSLKEVFSRSDVVSIHTPLLDETVGLITGEHLRLMKPYSTFINTSRGKVVRQNDLISVMKQRPDMIAVLDVLEQEPPRSGDEILTLDNIITTHHISGSKNIECTRMADFMIQELKRFLNNEPLQWQIRRDKAGLMA